jgi:hypothetical protein
VMGRWGDGALIATRRRPFQMPMAPVCLDPDDDATCMTFDCPTVRAPPGRLRALGAFHSDLRLEPR